MQQFWQEHVCCAPLMRATEQQGLDCEEIGVGKKWAQTEMQDWVCSVLLLQSP